MCDVITVHGATSPIVTRRVRPTDGVVRIKNFKNLYLSPSVKKKVLLYVIHLCHYFPRVLSFFFPPLYTNTTLCTRYIVCVRYERSTTLGFRQHSEKIANTRPNRSIRCSNFRISYLFHRLSSTVRLGCYVFRSPVPQERDNAVFRCTID